MFEPLFLLLLKKKNSRTFKDLLRKFKDLLRKFKDLKINYTLEYDASYFAFMCVEKKLEAVAQKFKDLILFSRTKFNKKKCKDFQGPFYENSRTFKNLLKKIQGP